MHVVSRFVLFVCLILPTRALAQEQKGPERDKPALDLFGDPLPPNAIARLGTVRFRDANISHVKFSPDGMMLATYGHRNKVSIWDAKTGQLIREIGDSKGIVLAALFTPDGKHIVCSEYDGTIRFYDIKTNTLQRSFKASHTYSLSISSDGKQLATRGRDNSFQVLDAETGKIIATEKAAGPVDRLEFSSDGKWLGIWNTFQFEVWDTEKWKVVQAVRGSHRSGKFTRDPNLALFVNDKHVMTLWDIESQKVVHQFKQEHFFYGLDVHPTKAIAVSGSPYGFFAVWDMKTGQQLKKCQTNMFYAWEPAFSGDGKRLAVCSNGGVEVWDSATWEPLLRFDVPDSPARNIAFAENGKEIISLHEYGGRFQISRWDMATAKEIHRTPDLKKTLHRRGLSGNAEWLVGWQAPPRPENLDPRLEDPPGTLTVWKTETGKVHWQWDLPKFMSDIAISSENLRLAVLHGHDTFTVFELASGKKLKSFEVRNSSTPPPRGKIKRPDYVYGVVLSPRADWLAGGAGKNSTDNSIVIWNTLTGQREFEFDPRYNTGERKLLFSPADRSLACAARFVFSTKPNEPESWVEIWEPFSGEMRRQLAKRTESITSMAFSPDGRQFATGYFNGDVMIWDIGTQQQLANFKGHRGGIGNLSYLPDGKSLASASWDSTILIWKLPTQPKSEMPTDKELEMHWTSFVSLNAKDAYTAMIAFRDHPERVAPFFEKRLSEHAISKLRDVPKLVADLDNPDFKVREHAFKKLQAMGPPIRPILKAALQKPSSVEARRRCEQLLEILQPLTIDPDAVLIQRVHELVQLVDTPETRRLLKHVPSP